MTRKMPALRRAGTKSKQSRAAREAAVIANLDLLAKHDPEGFAEMMRLLADLSPRR